MHFYPESKQKFCLMLNILNADLLIPLSSSHGSSLVTTGLDLSNICGSQSEFVQCHILFSKEVIYKR